MLFVKMTLPTEIEIKILKDMMYTRVGFDSSQFFKLYQTFPKAITHFQYIFINEFKNDSLFQHTISRFIKTEMSENKGNSEFFKNFYRILNWEKAIHPVFEMSIVQLYNFKEYIHWDSLLKHQRVPEYFLVQNLDKINLNILQIYQRDLSVVFLKLIKNHLDWNLVSEYQNFTVEKLKAFEHNVNWSIVSENLFNRECMVYFKDKIDWFVLCQNINVFHYLTDANVSECIDYIDWMTTLMYQNTLTEYMLFKYLDYFQLHNVLMFIELNESTLIHIVENYTLKDIHWNAIGIYQTLSDDFLRKYLKHLDPKIVSENQHLEMEFIADYANDLDWDILCLFQGTYTWTVDFIKKHRHFINFDLFFKNEALRISPEFHDFAITFSPITFE